MRALDLFCGAGGASRGLALASFDVVGVDRSPQPSYPYEFHLGDALAFDFGPSDFDLVWASPPCQAFTAYKRRPDHVKDSPDLIAATRAKLDAIGVPYVIENVGGAPLLDPVMLCGSMFGLDVRRHRYFETNVRCADTTMRSRCADSAIHPSNESD